MSSERPALLHHLETFLQQATPALRRISCLVAVSGGVDSVSLVHALKEAGCQRLHLLHFNHCLRGRSSNADETFVIRLGQSLKVPVTTGRGDVKALARREGLSLETAARQARYAFFAQVASRRRVPTLILAHHADDQVETFLFRLLRGSGPEGLTAMDPLATRGKLRLVRPLLSVTREEILDYARSRRLRWREDASNRSVDHTRNRIRHELLPLAHDILRRDTRHPVLRAIEILRADNDCLRVDPPSAVLAVAELRGLHPARQRRLLHAWLTHTHQVPGVTFEQVESIRDLLPPGRTRCRANLSHNLHVARSHGSLRLERP